MTPLDVIPQRFESIRLTTGHVLRQWMEDDTIFLLAFAQDFLQWQDQCLTTDHDDLELVRVEDRSQDAVTINVFDRETSQYRLVKVFVDIHRYLLVGAGLSKTVHW